MILGSIHGEVWSLLPLAVTLALAFWTRSAVFSLFVGCLGGVVLLGLDPLRGLTKLLQDTLGNGDFILLCTIIFLIGIIFELMKHAGVIVAFAARLSAHARSRRRVTFITWLLGFFIVDDYFSPLMTGAMVRPLSDRAKIPREKLAYILDATTASVCVLVPFTAWGAYLAGLIAAQHGPVADPAEGLLVFASAIPYNFYPILLILFTLGICLGLIPDFGPMRTAERRAKETGKLLRDGAIALVSDGEEDSSQTPGEKAHLASDLAAPIVIILGVALGSLLWLGSIKIAEAFLAATVYLSVSLRIQGRLTSTAQLMDLVTRGMKNVMPAVLLIALAYGINGVTKELGVAQFIIEISSGWLTAGWLPAIVFLITGTIAFATGTSWGAYALMMPLALPLAYEFGDGTLTPLVYSTIGAVTGGGIFGDHASPVSDTSILASTGAGSDHMDHVITQLPYAVLIAAITAVLDLVVA